MPTGESFDYDATILETLWKVWHFPVMFQVVVAGILIPVFQLPIYLSSFFVIHTKEKSESQRLKSASPEPTSDPFHLLRTSPLSPLSL